MLYSITTIDRAYGPEIQDVKLQVETFGFTLALGLEHTLSSRSKVGHVHPHSALSQCHETSFTAHGTDISTREVILLVDKLFKVNIFSQRHFGCVEGKDLALGVFCMRRLVGGTLMGIRDKTYGQGSQTESCDQYDQV